MYEIQELTAQDEWLEAFPVMHELRTHLDENAYLELLYKMADEGYKMFALFNDTNILAVTGVIIRTNFYDGRHVFVYDLVTYPSERSKGYGELLLTYIEQWAKEHGCEKLALDSGVQRIDAHRFYENRMGFGKFSYGFKKMIDMK
ncbi:GNAT family N-acetyltransferase [Paenibacillus xerothermodurans]|uniref:GNAT family N-acetyltransferase n=1 Tax=Paenibacillus xerothermodurans TaxID=1977292 RepID=A0A2W1NVB4_PAEXE|nr:GNAT family N-acetyltransferase [Paenibacillus xerothermodurans]PZE19632.1 GNAT family N-acetyltransferase [Paenibacillus xerothermodurans]